MYRVPGVLGEGEHLRGEDERASRPGAGADLDSAAAEPDGDELRSIGVATRAEQDAGADQLQMGVGDRVAVAADDEHESGRARDADRVAGLEPQRLLWRGPVRQHVTVAGDDDVGRDAVHREVNGTRGDHRGERNRVDPSGGPLTRPTRLRRETTHGHRDRFAA